MDFKAFPKVPRLFREVVVTEKIDGTNAQVLIQEILDGVDPTSHDTIRAIMPDLRAYAIKAGSRSRWLSRTEDNFGFFQFVHENRWALVRALGTGRHHGEWFGRGIQRGYGMKHRCFAVFNQDYEFEPVKDADGNVIIDKVPCAGRRDAQEQPEFLGNLITMLSLVPKVDSKTDGQPTQLPYGTGPMEGFMLYFPKANVTFKITTDGDGHKGS